MCLRVGKGLGWPEHPWVKQRLWQDPVMLPVGASVPLGLLPGRLTLSRTWGARITWPVGVGGGYQLQWQVTFRQAPFSEGVEGRCVCQEWELGEGWRRTGGLQEERLPLLGVVQC